MAQQASKTVYNASEKNILVAPHIPVVVPVLVGNNGVSTVSGKKIIPAGTPIGGDTDALEERQTVLQTTNTELNGSKAQGILLHDTDVTNGAANAQMVVFGAIDTSKCPKIEATAKAALTKIIFINGGVNNA